MDNFDIDLERAATQASRQVSRVETKVETQDANGVIDSTSDATGLHSVDSERLPAFGAGKPYPPMLTVESDSFVVDFDGPDDELHPFNWKFSAKFTHSAIGALACICSTFASAVFSTSTDEIGAHFGVSYEVSALSSALYLLGYAAGASCWGPMAEVMGRKPPLLISSFGFSVFATATAVSKDIQTLMISRFFMGAFGTAPLVVVAAMYTDMYRAEQRSYALVVFACSVFMGPMIAPVIGSFTVISYLGWRWNGYWSVIMGFSTCALAAFGLKETYPPIILVSKAAYLRRRTKNWAIHARQEHIETDVRELIEKNLFRPMRMLVTEPILLLVGIYISFVYGLMYISLAAFPFVFQGVHYMSPGVGSLPFFGMAIGMLCSGVASIAVAPRWVRMFHANGNRAVPEWRLPLACAGGIAFAMGLFWFGWTGYYGSVHWIVPTLASVFIGFGLLCIFMQLTMYLIDSYLIFAASALAGNTVVRSLFAAACPLFDRQMFEKLHINWTMTLLGCIAVALTPVPFAFMIYGKRIRQMSKWAPDF